MSDRCPKCGVEQPKPIAIEGPWLYYGEFFHEMDGNDCIRRQLEQAKAEIERLRREREVLAEAVRGYEIARETLLDLFGDSFVREGIRTAFSLVGSIREAALALLDGERGGAGE